ncbi:MAG: flagellar hook-basal body complex protein FliE [Oscillospiraceae bacterium]
MYIVPLSGLQPLQSITKTSPLKGTGSVNSGQAANGVDGSSFGDVFKKIYEDAGQAKEVADADSLKLAAGEADDLPSIMINSLRAATTMETATQLTSRAVGAYKEIMQMQV